MAPYDYPMDAISLIIGLVLGAAVGSALAFLALRARQTAGQAVGPARQWRALVVGFLLFPGCANSYTLEELPSTLSADRPSISLCTASPLTVAAPTDGSYGDRTYLGSGATVQRAVVSALRTFGVDAREEPAPVAIRNESSMPMWRVVPLILEWEDRATEWSGKPDRIRIELRTIDPSGTLVDAAIVAGASKWATLGGDHPQDMLRPAILPWAARFKRPTASR